MDDKVKPGSTMTAEDEVWTIGRLAERTGASPRSLRHYEASGLILPVRDTNGYRLYPETMVERVQRIRRLLRAGFNLSEIATLLPCMDHDPDRITICPEVAGVVDEKLTALLTQEQVLSDQRDQIRALIS